MRSHFNETSDPAMAEILVSVIRKDRDMRSVQIFEDKDSGLVKSNPFMTDASGLISFWAEKGSYAVLVEDSLPHNRFDPREIDWES